MSPITTDSVDLNPVYTATRQAEDHSRLFQFPTVYARPDVSTLTLDMAQVFQVLRKEQAGLVRTLFYAQTADCLAQELAKIAKPYREISAAIGHIMRSRFDRLQLRQMADESLIKIRQELEGGVSQLGGDAAAECAFCVNTLTRALRLWSTVVGTIAPEAYQERDKELALMFSTESRAVEMSLHMLILSLRERNLPTRPFLLDTMLRGLRSTVRMYGAISTAARLRRAASEPDLPFTAEDRLDDEERELLEWSADDASNTLRLEA